MNPHAVLGVAADATPEQIKSAYRKLAMKHHPDRNEGSDESAAKFQEIQNAYDMLRSDKPKQNQQQQQHHQNPHDGFNFHFDMDQMFAHMRQQMGNPNIHARAEITLEQAFQGCTVNFKVNDAGTIRDIACQIPAGIANGQNVRVAGVGGQPNPNHPPGDLIVNVMVAQHEKFHRLGMTLITQVDVDVIDMICGCEVLIPLIEGGHQNLRVQPNSKPEQNYTLPGKGMPTPNGPTRGDLHVRLNPLFRSFTQEQLNILGTL